MTINIHSPDDITEDDILALTHIFYTWVRKDDLLGPIFNDKIGATDEAWNPHIAKINDFWSNIFLRTGRYNGQPMSKHVGMPSLSPAHFTRWLELFNKAGKKTLPEAKYTRFNQTAERIAQSFQMGLAVHFSQNPENDGEENPFIEFSIMRPSRQHSSE